MLFNQSQSFFTDINMRKTIKCGSLSEEDHGKLCLRQETNLWNGPLDKNIKSKFRVIAGVVQLRSFILKDFATLQGIFHYCVFFILAC